MVESFSSDGSSPMDNRHLSGVSTPFHPTEFQSDVEYWARTTLRNEFAEAYSVVSIVHYKCTKKKEHEFLLVHLQHPSFDTVCLCLDRSPKPSEPKFRKVPCFTIKQDALSMASSSRFRSHDRVIVSVGGTDQSITQHFEPCKPLRVLKFSDDAPKPSLAQISALLCVITQEDYQLYARACYWFSGAMWEVLRNLFPHAVVTSEARVHPSTFQGVFIPQDYATPAIRSRYEIEWLEYTQKKFQKEEQRKRDEFQVLYIFLVFVFLLLMTIVSDLFQRFAGGKTARIRGGAGKNKSSGAGDSKTQGDDEN
jgi:hypothetical protein